MISNYHPAGTCMMGKENMGGVVDERLRVHGVKHLRVVDASAFPLMLKRNIITSVYATAERAADLIRKIRGANEGVIFSLCVKVVDCTTVWKQ